MADTKISGLPNYNSPILTDVLASVDVTSGATKKLPLSNLPAVLNAHEGFLVNGKIVPSVNSNNLTVALKGMDGNDPSASNPVYCRIGGVVRSITSALSITLNAGTNWFNSGSNELKTKEIDYFVYLGFNTTDGVVMGFSRIPYANLYSDFNTTNTNERYCSISTITNATANDQYVNIGRFAATLSAGSAYTWSVPAYTAANLIQRPIFNTRILSYNPQYTCNGSMTIGTITTAISSYEIINTKLFVRVRVTASTLAGTASGGINVSTPMYMDSSAYQFCLIYNNSIYFSGYTAASTSDSYVVLKPDLSNYVLGAGTQFNFLAISDIIPSM